MTLGRSLESARRERWAVILAGGDGFRLRSLTRTIAGDDRPKQFCPVLGEETLLDQTRRRAGLLIPAGRTVVAVTRCHERFYSPLVAETGPEAVVVQPENRGTAPAILLALLRVAARAPAASVAIFPSDHHVSDDGAFMAYVDAAFDAVLSRPDLVTLLGITPDRAEAEYGWIERDEWIRGQGPGALYRVRRFWEKPSPAVAEALLARGCLWNSFVMVARVPTLLALIRSALPGQYDAFTAIRPMLDTRGGDEALRVLYARLPHTNFSKEVLARQAASLAVLPVSGVRWTDLGDPQRVRRVEQGPSRQLDPLVA